MIFILGLQLTPHPNPVLDLLHAHGDSTKSLRLSSLVPFAIRTYFVPSVRKSALPHRGQSDGARDKVCHPELVSGSELYAKHTSPYPLLLRRGRSIIVHSTVTDYSLFTIHYSLILMQTFRLLQEGSET